MNTRSKKAADAAEPAPATPDAETPAPAPRPNPGVGGSYVIDRAAGKVERKHHTVEAPRKVKPTTDKGD